MGVVLQKLPTSFAMLTKLELFYMKDAGLEELPEFSQSINSTKFWKSRSPLYILCQQNYSFPAMDTPFGTVIISKLDNKNKTTLVKLGVVEPRQFLHASKVTNYILKPHKA